MDVSAEVQAYLDGTNRSVRQVATALHNIMMELGCSAYVKTIYIGYDINGEMAAAAYAHANHVVDPYPPELFDAKVSAIYDHILTR